jgi:hypothetical protein
MMMMMMMMKYLSFVGESVINKVNVELACTFGLYFDC